MAAPITPSKMAPMVNLKSGIDGEGESDVAISKILSRVYVVFKVLKQKESRSWCSLESKDEELRGDAVN